MVDIDWQEIKAQYAQMLEKGVNELTDQEKAQAAMNAFLEHYEKASQWPGRVEIVNAMMPRRVVAVAISVELMQAWLTEGWTLKGGRGIRCVHGLPEGARFAGQTYQEPDTISLFFEHDSFSVVGTGEVIPILMCEYTEQDVDA